MKNRHLLIAFLLILTGLVLIYRPATPNPPPPSVASTPIPLSATLNIDYGNHKSLSYTQDLPASSSAFSLLQLVASRQNIPITFKTYSFGTLVESINGFKNSSQKAWIYFVNDKSPNIGADQYILAPGDKVDWQYTKPAF